MKTRVLIADDEVKSRDFFRGAVSDLGCEAITATNGANAVKLAAELRPDILILDGLMPHLGGFEAARFVRNIDEAYKPRIVIATGVYKKVRYRNEAPHYGVDAYLVKPVQREQIANAIFG
jgi:CheY-like chemotaxis protein